MAGVPTRPTTHSRAETARALNPSRLRRAFRFAFEGLAWAWRTQPNFRIEIGIGAAAVALALALDAPVVPILLCCGLVLPLELLNSALEAAVDLASPGLSELAKTAKDTAAAAVLVASLVSAGVGLWVLLPPLIATLFGFGSAG